MGHHRYATCLICHDSGFVGPMSCVCPTGTQRYLMESLSDGNWYRECETTIGEILRDNAYGNPLIGKIAAALRILPLNGVAQYDAGAGGVTRFTRIQ